MDRFLQLFLRRLFWAAAGCVLIGGFVYFESAPENRPGMGDIVEFAALGLGVCAVLAWLQWLPEQPWQRVKTGERERKPPR